MLPDASGAPRPDTCSMPYALPPLPYPYDALAPTIDELTMRIHHDKHHRDHVADLNAALEGTEWADRPLEQLLARIDLLPDDARAAIRENGGAHANHMLFWDVMSPYGGGAPGGRLGDAIEATFQSFGEMKRQIRAAGGARCGSGWAWLVHDGEGLAVTSTPNQDSPLMYGHTPLLGVDVWEHAYYFKYQHRRTDYLEAWWNVVDWRRVAERYATATGPAPTHERPEERGSGRQWLPR
jgi:superoxide dismutase, Fe-Mn family